ncbi:MAG: class I SAM-dependent methyltransferase [Acidimicrobiia bacterium]
MSSMDRIARARAIRSPADAIDVYRDWVADYDDDVFGTLAFTGTDRIVELFAAHQRERSAPVVDLGCGTGAAGIRLREQGFATVDGIDISPDMLAVAETKHAYRQLFVADLGAPLALPSGTYGGSVSAGTFTSGHVGPDAIAEIIRILRPGAVVAWVVAASVWPAFAPALTAAGVIVLHDAEEPIRRDGPPEARMLVARLPSGG